MRTSQGLGNHGAGKGAQLMPGPGLRLEHGVSGEPAFALPPPLLPEPSSR